MTNENRNQLLASLAELIDNEIHHSYHLMPTNYIAFDLLHDSKQFEEKYSKEIKLFIGNGNLLVTVRIFGQMPAYKKIIGGYW